ncbi:MAG: DUF4760 domain-containing protein [Acidobacteriota bacterium]
MTQASSVQRQVSAGTVQDAEIILKLYDLRREEKMREARHWFQTRFKASSLDEFQKQTSTRQANTYFRNVINYWEMACMFVSRGILNEEMFFETSGEILSVWEKIRPILRDIRKSRKNPLFMRHTEEVCKRFIDWVNREAPGAYDWVVSLNQPE